MAGESAKAMAAAKRSRSQELLREAERYERGAEGEEATARALDALPRESWSVFHDVHWPGRPQANIDHVVIGPGGVFVVDSKNWTGVVRVANGILHRDGRPMRKTVDGARAAALAIGQLAPSLDPRLVVPVLCFHSTEKVASTSSDVRICSTATIAVALLSQPDVLSASVRRLVTTELDAQLWPAVDPLPDALLHRPEVAVAKRRKTATSTARVSSVRLVKIVPPLAVVIGGLLVATHPDVLSSVAAVVAGLMTAR